jgi:hypothetical protein
MVTDALPTAWLEGVNENAIVSQTGVYIGNQMDRRPLDDGKTLHYNIGGSQYLLLRLDKHDGRGVRWQGPGISSQGSGVGG